MSTKRLPVLALRDTVLFPGHTVPIGIGRKKTLRALEAALASDQEVLAVAQRQNQDDPTSEDLYRIGVIGRILDVERGRNGVRIVLEATERGHAHTYELKDGYLPVPDGPGLGITLNEAALNQPENPKVLDTPIGFDGSVQDR